ncbi:MAG: protein translocase subunit SecD, partial [Actinomycetia bacterium]|nr:protein translocase subunit SecD [Actinomycetes bacterium]
VGYSAASAQYSAPNSQIVSCDASGGKYVLGKAVFRDSDITSIATGQEQNTRQWVVDVTLDRSATAAFGALTTNQYNLYYSGYQGGNENDAVLNQTAVVLDGNVQSAPETDGAITAGQLEIAGPQPAGFTKVQAQELAAQLKAPALAAHLWVPGSSIRGQHLR